MKRSVQVIAIAFGVAVTALIVAGCGSKNNDSSSSTSSNNSAASTPQRYGSSGSIADGSAAKVSVGTVDVGKILVGKNGQTLYMFLKDKGGKSACSGACVGAWPPLVTQGTPQAGAGVTASKLSTTKRSNGVEQVVYAGHPLYYYAPDTKAGQTTGQGLNQFGAEWYVVGPSGSKVEKSGS
jgi:predicted lipoprotein with Yx(FWY)xxD motif